MNGQPVYALVNIQSLHDVSKLQTIQPRTKKKPGPKESKARLKFYLLPNDGQLPKLSKQDPAIEMHHQQGFGYPSGHYENLKGKRQSIRIDMSEEELKQFIRGLYPVIKDREFSFFTIDNNRKLTPAPFSLKFFKENRYQGTIVIKLKKEIPTVKAEKLD